ncbi:fungal-specific transcription factor domain-containing protein [Tricladium varicosporioides]|nr:fungal-specific transcription factor domain-containing protein [Hymenoscyphus varicosporioides]
MASAHDPSLTNNKNPRRRKCVSNACTACRKRRSKCNGAKPSCANCSTVYHTACVYVPGSDTRRKGVYRARIDNLAPGDSSLKIVMQRLLNEPEEKAIALLREIRTCESLDDVTSDILSQQTSAEDEGSKHPEPISEVPLFNSKLSAETKCLRVENQSLRFLGGTSNLVHLKGLNFTKVVPKAVEFRNVSPVTSWTRVTDDSELIVHLLNMYFTWHHPYFTVLSKDIFYRDFLTGNTGAGEYCTSLLVNTMLALGSHFSSQGSGISSTSSRGDNFFEEARRLLLGENEYETPRITTVQALALMSIREAGCGRELSGWTYSGMSFRMSQDLGLNIDMTSTDGQGLDAETVDARRVAFWGTFLTDQFWSNYMGRLPQLGNANLTLSKRDIVIDENVGPNEDATFWVAYTAVGLLDVNPQPAHTKEVSLHILKLCEISGDIQVLFYYPGNRESSPGKYAMLKRLGCLQVRLEDWKNNLPVEIELNDKSLPNVILMHMFFQLLYIHLFRPFLQYSNEDTPLPATVSPRNICTKAAAKISSQFRLYKKIYGLQQISNVAVFFLQSACMVHLLNLPDRTAKRDLSLAFTHFEEIGPAWPCAHRAIGILGFLAAEWAIELPEAAETVLIKGKEKYDLGEFLVRPNVKSEGFSKALACQVPSLDEYGISNDPVSYSSYASSRDSRSSISDSSMLGMVVDSLPEMEGLKDLEPDLLLFD